MNFIIFELLNVIFIGLVILIIFVSIFINFLISQSGKAKKEKKSIVETGSMIAFFLLFYLVIRLNLGILNYDFSILRVCIMFICWIILLIGVYFNISGRFYLGKNWANQIKIYKNQTLVTSGVYSIVRHPLYASLIWMFYAASIIYFNWLTFLLNTLVFIPMMYYRAKQEERLLEKEFKNYRAYKKEVGMFFPKLVWGLKNEKEE